jgi:hypothetical protein
VHDSWPGNLLIEALREVWEDGVIDSNELEALAELLVSIVQPDYSPFDQESNLHVQVGLKSGKDLPPVIQTNSLEGESFIPPEAFIKNDELKEALLDRTRNKSDLGFSSEDDLIKLQSKEEEKFKSNLQKVFDSINQPCIATETLQDLEEDLESIYDQQKKYRELMSKRTSMAEHVDGVLEGLFGDKDDLEHWSNYFDKKPPKDLVRKCAGKAYCQGSDEFNKQGDIYESEINFGIAKLMESDVKRITIESAKPKEPKATAKQVNYSLSLAPNLKEEYVKALGKKQISGLIEKLISLRERLKDQIDEIEDRVRFGPESHKIKDSGDFAQEYMISLINSEL